jgi:hypothetical protein
MPSPTFPTNPQQSLTCLSGHAVLSRRRRFHRTSGRKEKSSEKRHCDPSAEFGQIGDEPREGSGLRKEKESIEKKASAEKAVQENWRKARRRFSTEEKTWIERWRQQYNRAAPTAPWATGLRRPKRSKPGHRQ